MNISNLTSGYSTSEPATTASVTVPQNGVCYVTVVATTGGTNWATETRYVDLSGLSLSWSSIGEMTYADRRKLFVFRAINGGSEASGTLTIDYVNDTNYSFGALAWSVDLVTGANTTTPNDSSVNGNVTGGTSLTLPDAGTPDAGDAIFGAFGFEATGDSFAIDASLTTLATVTGETNHIRQLHVGYDASSPLDETLIATWTTDGNGCGGVAFVINASEASPTNRFARAYGPDGQRVFTGLRM